jgi:DNA polymerase
MGVNRNPILSHKKVCAFCEEIGIPAPKSLAEDNAECAVWEQKYGTQYPIINALRVYRKANILLRKCEAIQNRLMPDRRMCIGLRYFGAAGTGRLSGSNGWNIQNLPRVPFHNVDIRKLLIPGPGQKFVISDYSQIEPRISNWLSGNTAVLTELARGFNLYEADAIAAGTWNGEPGTFKKTNPAAYQLQKAQTLGIGYGMGPARFCEAARAQLGLTFTLDAARRIVAEWHARNPGVRVLWNEYEHGLRTSFHRGEDYAILLPSARRLNYRQIQRVEDSGRVRYSACPTYESRRSYFWGGKLFENVVQAIARDVLRDAVLRLEYAGVPVIFTAHDEAVCEVPEDYPATQILHLMLTSSPWAETLPLAAEIIEAKAYTK